MRWLPYPVLQLPNAAACESDADDACVSLQKVLNSLQKDIFYLQLSFHRPYNTFESTHHIVHDRRKLSALSAVVTNPSFW